MQRSGSVRAGRGGIYLRCRRGHSVTGTPSRVERGVGMFGVNTERKTRGPVREVRGSWESVGRSEVFAEGSGVMLQDCSNVSGTR